MFFPIRALSFVLLLFSRPGLGQAPAPQASANKAWVVESIVIEGNQRTQDEVILRELATPIGHRLSEAEIQIAMERLRATGLFSSVSFKLTDQVPEQVTDQRPEQTPDQLTENQNPPGATLVVQVVEKWTTIPILKLNSGGGVQQTTVGLYDPNLLGRYLEAGVQYEDLAGAGSGVLWFKNPRLFDQRQGLDLQYWNTKRIRIKYDQTNSDPVIKTGFLHEREKIYVDYFREIAAETTLRFGLDYNRDQFSTKILPEEVKEIVGSSPTLPPPTRLVIAKLALELGAVSGDPQSLSGRVLTLSLSHAHSLSAEADSFQQADLSLNWFDTPLARVQWAQRILAGATSTQILQYWYYLGGLDRIRGFAENRFAGRQFLLSNSELRYLLLQTPSYLLQGAGFIDWAAVGENIADLDRIHAASYGAGLRLILPKFYRFVIRIDYAQAIIKNDDSHISFGVQQFF